ncbi:MAG: transglutaminase, partial [Bacillota bacterium]|nr:transglutaminase [Bacillota bacterium]
MNSRGSNRNLHTLLLYLFAFLLLWEWLRPVEQLTNTDHIEVFLLFLLIAFIGSYFESNRILLISIKTIYTLVSIYNFYYTGGFFGSSWWKKFFNDINRNIGNIVSGNWYDLSNVFNTLLFFILLWLLVYLLHYWLLNRQRIFLFFLLTVIYLAVLDTFTQYNANSAIVRTIVSGFMVMGMLKFYRLLKVESLVKEHFFTRKWMVPLLVMVAFSTAIGIIAPKAAPMWPDPVPFIKSLSEKSSNDGTGGIAKIGYGTNDSRLGGPFIGDKT